MEYLEKNLVNRKKIIICLSDKSKLKNIKKFITVDNILTNFKNIYDNKVNIINYDIDEGFELENYIVLCENELYKSRNKDINYKNKFKYGSKITDINSLNKGDYVVHLTHGIGMYCGIKTLSKNGILKDYLEVQYKDSDKLYIPVEKIDLISKYESIENLYKNLENLDIKAGTKVKLETSRESAFLSKELGTICLEAPVSTNLEDYNLVDFQVLNYYNRGLIVLNYENEDIENAFK